MAGSLVEISFQQKTEEEFKMQFFKISKKEEIILVAIGMSNEEMKRNQ